MNKMGRPITNTPETIKERIIVSDAGCWIWQGYKDRDGYGRMRLSGKERFTHRIAYEAWVAPLEPKKVIMHTCDTPACCNPDHLKQGTHGENNRDCAAKGRKPKGSKNGNAKLTEYQVLKIREWYFGGMSQDELSKIFNISRVQLRKIIYNINWIYTQPLNG